MMKQLYKITLLMMCLSLVACSDDDDNDVQTQPTTTKYNIVGTWLEYAYLNSDGYFTNITSSGYNSYYEFDSNGTFTSWEEYTSGEHYDGTTGTWEYSDVENVVLVTEPRGWNLNITLTWNDADDVQMAIVQRGGSASTIKARRVN